MKILSIFNGKNSSVSYSEGDTVLYVCGEERLTREKLIRGYPHMAIKDLLQRFNLDPADIDMVVCGAWSRPDRSVVESFLGSINEKNVKSSSDRLFSSLDVDRFYREEFLVKAGRMFPNAQIKLYDHHLSHAASAFFGAGYEDSYVVTADGRGDLQSIVVWKGSRKKGLDRVVSFSELKSLGAFYGQVTYLLGFKPDRHEGKITGLAAFGKPTPLVDYFSSLINFDAGDVKVHDDHIPFMRPNNTSKISKALSAYSKEDIAFAAQEVLERVIIDLIKYYVPAGSKLAAAGGIFANVKLNQRIRERCGTASFFIFPDMSDSGISYGALMLAMSENNIAPQALKSVYLGPDYEWASTDLSDYQVQSFDSLDETAQEASDLIANLKVAGIFTGRMEFGPRALGSRTIMCHTSDSNLNDTINKRLNRSEFMPFAPVTLEECASDMYIDYSSSDQNVQFMTTCYECTPKMQEMSPAVVHVDNTARPQIINEDHDHALYYKILKNYYEKTGIPSLVNTSFNNHEEPIVCSPEDALDSLNKDNIDIIVTDKMIISRK